MSKNKKSLKSNNLRFNFGDKVVEFQYDDFEDELDLDKLLKIDYSNLFAEILTFPVVVNRLGILAAKMDNKVQEAKIDLAVYEAKKKNKIRDEWEGVKKPTIDEVDSALVIDVKYILKKKLYFKVIQDKEILYSVYMSAKDKSEKLNKLSLSIKTGDINEHIIQSQLNKVYFKMQQGKITD
jgi:hypothetical protein